MMYALVFLKLSIHLIAK